MQLKKVKNNSKKIIIISCIIILVFSLTSCGKKVGASRSGDMLRLSMEKIKNENMQGVFVMNEDETFTPVLADVPGFDGSTAKAEPSRYIWFTDNEMDISSLIPVVTQDTPLVAIYSSNANLPQDWYLEKYKDKGYTIGAHIFIDENQQMIIDKTDTLASSSADKILTSDQSPDDVYTIERISGTKNNALPLKNVDNNMRILLGFDKNKLFTFDFFRGTQMESVEMYADTRIFQSEKLTELKAPFKKTSQGYFIINLPLNLANGYYYISDIGLFRYQG